MSTERQLFDLLGAAAGRLFVRLHFYTMEATPRSEWGRDYVRRYYRGIDDLLNRQPGRNDRDRRRAESRQPDGRAILDRLTQRSWTGPGRIPISSVFSCLAVHAAVLHMDGVERHKLPAKCIGVFAQTKTRDHPLMHDVPSDLQNTARPVERGAGRRISRAADIPFSQSRRRLASIASSSSRRRAFSSISRAIRNTRPRACWANTEGTWVGSSGERTKSVRRYREVILVRRRKRS